MKEEKRYTHLDTPGGVVKLPRPMTDEEYYAWLEEGAREWKAEQEKKKRGKQ